MNSVKNEIQSLHGKQVRLTKRRTHPGDEKFYKIVHGYIEQIYPRMFVILRTDIDNIYATPQRTCFTYSDIIIGDYDLEVVA